VLEIAAKRRGPFVLPGGGSCEADAGRCETLIYTEKPRLRSAKLLSLTMVAAILFPPAFSHRPFPTGGRQRLLSREGGLATEIRPAADL